MDFAKQRKQMVASQLKSRGIGEERVLAAFREVKREDFVSARDQHEAYGDYPLPIGEGQTISQPYIVALMVEKLELEGGERVLELGTGSGYQTAILAMLASKVYTIERRETLLAEARKRLKAVGLCNVTYRTADGTLGWEEEAPFDRVIISAACPHVPAPLVKQLAPNGIVVAPLGPRLAQRLVVARKKDNRLEEEGVCGCSFVPLVGEYGFRE